MLWTVQLPSALGDCYLAVTSELSGTKSRLSQSLGALKELAINLLE